MIHSKENLYLFPLGINLGHKINFILNVLRKTSGAWAINKNKYVMGRTSSSRTTLTRQLRNPNQVLDHHFILLQYIRGVEQEFLRDASATQTTRVREYLFPLNVYIRIIRHAEALQVKSYTYSENIRTIIVTASQTSFVVGSKVLKDGRR